MTSAYDASGRLATRQDAPEPHPYSYTGEILRGDTITGTGVLSGFAVTQTVVSGKITGQNVTGVPALTQSFGYHPTTGRPESVTGAVLTATYGYLPQSDWLESTALTEGGTQRLLSTRTLDSAGRLQSIAASRLGAPLESHTWTYDPVTGRRTRATLGTPQAPLDGSYWEYDYNDRSEVTSAARKLASTVPVHGRSHGYTFDALGNRLTNTVNGRASTYSPTALNQSTQRTVPGGFDVLGEAATGATVTVNNQPTTRQAGLFSYSTTAANTAAPAFPTLSIVGVKQNAGPSGEDAVTTATGKVFLARTPEVFTDDADGNLTGDGRWTYTWDAENRLATMETQPAAVTAGVPRVKLEFTYDARHRRIQKLVRTGWTGTAYTHTVTTRFLFDEGWNVLAEYEAVNSGPSTLTRSYLWGLDLSGTRQGAGGIGGLLALRQHTGPQAGTYLPLYDGHGNVTGLLRTSDGVKTASYEYGPFGEPLRATGPMAELNPFRFSTKYQDNETGLLYYGHRYYQPQTGRWLSRDPIAERGGQNLYGFCLNNAVRFVDRDGREIVFTGEQSAIDAAKKIFEEAKAKASEQLKAAIKGIEDDKTACRIKLTWNSKIVIIGNYTLGVIDLGDVNKLPATGGGLTIHSVFIHELYEQWMKQKDQRPYKAAHYQAEQAEILVSGNRRVGSSDTLHINNPFSPEVLSGTMTFKFRRVIKIDKDGKETLDDKTVTQTINVSGGNIDSVSEQ